MTGWLLIALAYVLALAGLFIARKEGWKDTTLIPPALLGAGLALALAAGGEWA